MAGTGKHLVLIAADESEHTAKTIDWYVESMHRSDFKVLIVYVLEITELFVEEDLNLNVWQEVNDKIESVKTKYLEQLKSKGVEDAEAKVIQFGRPGEVIVREAQENGAVLIVMGTRGQGSVRRSIVGSVSNYVVHHAHCPVVVYRQ